VARVAAEPRPAASVGIAEAAEPTDGSLALAASAAPSLDAIRDAVCRALDSEGHNTAAAQLLSGNWTVQGSTIQVELPMRKTMLALTINADAEAICRKAMRAIGATQKITFVPSENGAASAAPARSPGPIAGSAQSAALDNPLVRKTKELFKADIRSVLDLRDNASGKDNK
jgi:DNA polymerase-3 subunit gamma/tau